MSGGAFGRGDNLHYYNGTSCLELFWWGLTAVTLPTALYVQDLQQVEARLTSAEVGRACETSPPCEGKKIRRNLICWAEDGHATIRLGLSYMLTKERPVSLLTCQHASPYSATCMLGGNWGIRSANCFVLT